MKDLIYKTFKLMNTGKVDLNGDCFMEVPYGERLNKVVKWSHEIPEDAMFDPLYIVDKYGDVELLSIGIIPRTIVKEVPVHIKITAVSKHFDESIHIPKRESRDAAGYDLRACINPNRSPIWISFGERKKISCGFAIEIPKGYHGEIRPRSGLAWKYGITVLNSPGTVDADFRGEIKVILVNLGNGDIPIYNGDRVAQLVFSQNFTPKLKLVPFLNKTERGTGGFGSTGR